MREVVPGLGFWFSNEKELRTAPQGASKHREWKWMTPTGSRRIFWLSARFPQVRAACDSNLLRVELDLPPLRRR